MMMETRQKGRHGRNWMMQQWMSVKCKLKSLRREVATLWQENMEIQVENSEHFMWSGRTLVEIKQRLIEIEKVQKSGSDESSSEEEEEEEKVAEGGNEGMETGVEGGEKMVMMDAEEKDWMEENKQEGDGNQVME
jgi:hypothetical protein